MKLSMKLSSSICLGIWLTSCLTFSSAEANTYHLNQNRNSKHSSRTTKTFESFLSPVNAPQKTDVKIIVEHYRVIAKTADELLRELKSKGPAQNPKGGRFFGQANWKVNWSYKYAKTRNGCKAKDIQTQLIVTYKLPKWINPSRSKPGLVKYWNQFLDKLIIHEMGHAQIGYNTKNEIHDLLSSHNRTNISCSKLGKELNSIAHNVIDSSKADKVYDKKTRHGGTQGANFSTKDAKRMK